MSYANDADGNTLSGGGRTMTWDSQNRMVSCSYNGNTLAFDYGSDGLRRSETLTSGGQSVTTYYVYDGQSLVMEETKNAQGVLTPSASYLNGPRGPEYKKDETTGLVKWYLYDGLGSVIGEVDPAGNVTYSAKYDVYGGVRATMGTATSAQGFVGGCGHLSEASTGLIYMRARYYDPNTGRFASEDPKRNGSNWYLYCADNPVNNVDPDGHASQQAWSWWGAGMGFALAANAFAAAVSMGGGVFMGAYAMLAACAAVYCFKQALDNGPVDGVLDFVGAAGALASDKLYDALIADEVVDASLLDKIGGNVGFVAAEQCLLTVWLKLQL